MGRFILPQGGPHNPSQRGMREQFLNPRPLSNVPVIHKDSGGLTRQLLEDFALARSGNSRFSATFLLTAPDKCHANH